MTHPSPWKRVASTVAITLALSAVAAHAQPISATPLSDMPGYTMPSTHMWDMKSDGGEVYRIFVSYPTGEAPADGYPVLYVLDGNASFAAFAEARRIQERSDIGKSIVVGVGYPTDLAYDTRRLNDYPPAMLEPPPKIWRHLAKFKSGGRDAFLDFLTGPLRAEIARRYTIDPDRQSLFGHSLGGLLALHALYTRPSAFHSIVAASPSLEWNEQGVLAEEREFTRRMTSGKVGKTSRLLIVVGGRDTDDDPYMAEAFANRMEQLSIHGLRTRFRGYDEEGHMTVPARAVTDTLRFVFGSR